MKFKQLTLLGSILLASKVFAGIAISQNGSLQANACANVPGTWEGGGEVKSGLIKCHYHGRAVVTHSLSSFNMAVDMVKDSGICPDHESLTMTGSCDNGYIRFNTDNADLEGQLNADGTQANLEGDVSFVVLGSHIKADVRDLELHKL